MATRTAVGLALFGPVLAGCGSHTRPTASALFGITTVVAQAEYKGGHWLVAGLVCPGSSSSCGYDTQDLVLAGAVSTRGQWRVRLLVRYETSPQVLSDPCRAQQTRHFVPGEPVIIVGCFNGGSDQEGFVTVLGFNPGVDLPEVLLAIDCGVTNWVMRGSSLVIESSDLRSGAGVAIPSHPDVSFTWQQDGRMGSTVPAQFYASAGAEGSGFPSFCEVLRPSND